MIQNEKGEEVICRREAKTGSRLARETICMTKAEWLRVSEESQRQTKKSMRDGENSARHLRPATFQVAPLNAFRRVFGEELR